MLIECINSGSPPASYMARDIFHIALDKKESFNLRVGAINYLSQSRDPKVFHVFRNIIKSNDEKDGLKEWAIFGLGELLRETPMSRSYVLEAEALLEGIRSHYGESMAAVANEALEKIRASRDDRKENYPNYPIDEIKFRSSYINLTGYVDEKINNATPEFLDSIYDWITGANSDEADLIWISQE